MTESGLNANQQRALAALLGNPSVTAAAKAAQVSEASLYRWMRTDEVFQREYRAGRREAYDGAVSLLQTSVLAGVRKLVALLDADSESVQLRAASNLVELAMKGVEVMDIVPRLEALEQAVKEQRQ